MRRYSAEQNYSKVTCAGDQSPDGAKTRVSRGTLGNDSALHSIEGWVGGGTGQMVTWSVNSSENGLTNQAKYSGYVSDHPIGSRARSVGHRYLCKSIKGKHLDE